MLKQEERSFFYRFNSFLRTDVNYDNRVWGLDLVRAIAILQVVYVHGAMLILPMAGIKVPPLYHIDGVQIFFVLSGFLIGGIVLKEIEKPDWGISRLFTFLSRRWMRTLPLYYLILLLNIFVVYFGIISQDIHQLSLNYFTFTYNLTHRNTGFFWESWSLSIEEWFYLLFSLFLFIFIHARYELRTRKIMFLVVIAIFIFVPALIRTYSPFDHTDQNHTHAVLYRLDSAIYGVVGAFVYRYFPIIWSRSRYILFLLGLLIIVNADTGILIIDRSFYNAVESIGILFTFPLLSSIRYNRSIFGKIITHISLISYSAYLINHALTAEVLANNFHSTSPLTVWVLYFVYWILVLFNSSLLYRYFEKPIMDRRPH
jgi:peptidoglycan/LPS O-acetylase OafA/YrhL